MQLLLSWICRWNTWGHFISAYENIGSTCKSHSKDEKPQRKIYISLVPLELYVGHKLWSQTINLHLRTNLKVLNICVWIHHSSEKSNSMWKDTNPAHFIGHLSHLCFHFFTGRLNNLWISLRGLWAKEKAGSGTLTKWWWPRLGTAFTLSCFVFVCAFSLCNFQSLSFFFFFIISRNGSSSRGILRISEQPVSPGRGRLKRWKVSFVVGFSSWPATPSGQTLKNLLKRSQVTLGHLWHLTLSSCAGCTAWTWSSSASLLDWWSSLRWNDVFMFSNKIWMSVKVRNEHKSGQQMSKTKLKDSRANLKKKRCVLAGSDGSSLRFHSQEDCPQSRAGHCSGLLCPHGLQCESHIWQRPLLCHAFEYALRDFSANVSIDTTRSPYLIIMVCTIQSNSGSVFTMGVFGISIMTYNTFGSLLFFMKETPLFFLFDLHLAWWFSAVRKCPGQNGSTTVLHKWALTLTHDGSGDGVNNDWTSPFIRATANIQSCSTGFTTTRGPSACWSSGCLCPTSWSGSAPSATAWWSWSARESAAASSSGGFTQYGCFTFTVPKNN